MQQKLFHKIQSIVRSFTLASAPIDLAKITKELNLKVVYSDEIPNTVSGVLDCRNAESPLILINKNKSENHQRFSLAHEIGHYLLHSFDGQLHMDGNMGVFFRSSQDGITSSNKSYNLKIEREANVFAAELLMPKDLLESEVNSRYQSIDMTLVEELSKTFAVSQVAMAIRMREVFGVKLEW